MSIPFFSVIIPTYNRQDLVEKAIESVLAQDCRDYELIVVDDGSTDGSWENLQKFSDRIVLLKQNNRGVSAARNAALKVAKGEWVSFLDSDDLWYPHKLRVQKQYIKENPSYKIVHSDEVWFRNHVRVNPMKKHAKGGGDQFYRSLELCVISPSAVAIRKDLILELGGFREDFPACEDYDLWLKITAKYPVGYIQEQLVIKYGGHEDQLSQKFKAMDYWRVLSIDWLLNNHSLNLEQREKAVSILIKKLKILIKGHQKYNHLEKVHELNVILKHYH